MSTLAISKCEEYVSYAEFCLTLAKGTSDRDTRIMLREMAAEWLVLTDVEDRSSSECTIAVA